jgi:hypothetical protein
MIACMHLQDAIPDLVVNALMNVISMSIKQLAGNSGL